MLRLVNNPRRCIHIHSFRPEEYVVKDPTLGPLEESEPATLHSDACRILVGDNCKTIPINLTYFIFESVFFDVPRAVSQIQFLNK